jgi:uncharacterized surface protein with fasciclin (FAS1) repeats
LLTTPTYKIVLGALSGGNVQSPDPFTMLAPNNAAFAASIVNLTDTALVINIMTYHLLTGISGNIVSTDLVALQFPATMTEDPISVSRSFAGPVAGQVIGVAAVDGVVAIKYGLNVLASVAKATTGGQEGHHLRQWRRPYHLPSYDDTF